MKGAKIVLMAVAETDKARSPLLIRVSAFEPPPVGVVPRTIIPMAKALPVAPGISWINTKESKKATRGIQAHLINTAIPTTFGFWSIRSQSLRLMARPIVNIIIIRRYGPAGGTTLFSTEG